MTDSVATITSITPTQFLQSNPDGARVVMTGTAMTTAPTAKLTTPSGADVPLTVTLIDGSNGTQATFAIPASFAETGLHTLEVQFPNQAPISPAGVISVAALPATADRVLPVAFADGEVTITLRGGPFLAVDPADPRTAVTLRPAGATATSLQWPGRAVASDPSQPHVLDQLVFQPSEVSVVQLLELVAVGDAQALELILGVPDDVVPNGAAEGVPNVRLVALGNVHPAMGPAGADSSASLTLDGLEKLPDDAFKATFSTVEAALVSTSDGTVVPVAVSGADRTTSTVDFSLAASSSSEPGVYTTRLGWPGYAPTTVTPNSPSSYNLYQLDVRSFSHTRYPANLGDDHPVEVTVNGEFFAQDDVSISFQPAATTDPTQAVVADVSVRGASELTFAAPDFGDSADAWNATLVVHGTRQSPQGLDGIAFLTWRITDLSPDLAPANLSATELATPQDTGFTLTGVNLPPGAPLALRIAEAGTETLGETNAAGTHATAPIPNTSLLGSATLQIRFGGDPYHTVGPVSFYSTGAVTTPGSSVDGGVPVEISMVGLDQIANSQDPTGDPIVVSFGLPGDPGSAISPGTLKSATDANGVTSYRIATTTPRIDPETVLSGLGRELFGEASGRGHDRPVDAVALGPLAADLNRSIHVSIEDEPWIDSNHVQPFHIVGGPQPSLAAAANEDIVLQGFNFNPDLPYVVATMPTGQPVSAIADASIASLVPATFLNVAELLFTFAPAKPVRGIYDIYVAQCEMPAPGSAADPALFSSATAAINFDAFDPTIFCFDADRRQPFTAPVPLAAPIPVAPPGAGQTAEVPASIYMPSTETLWDLGVTMDDNGNPIVTGTTTPSRSTSLSTAHFGVRGSALTTIDQWALSFYQVTGIDRPVIPAQSDEGAVVTILGRNFPTIATLTELTAELPALRGAVPEMTAVVKIVDAAGKAVCVLATITSNSQISLELPSGLSEGQLDLYLAIGPGLAVDDQTIPWPDSPVCTAFAYAAKSVSPPLVSTAVGATLSIIGTFPTTGTDNTVEVTLTRANVEPVPHQSSTRIQSRIVGAAIPFPDPTTQDLPAENSHTERLIGSLQADGSVSLQVPDGLPTGHYSVSVRLTDDSDLGPSRIDGALYCYAIRGLRQASYGPAVSSTTIGVSGVFDSPQLRSEEAAGRAEVLFGTDPDHDRGTVVSITRTQLIATTPNEAQPTTTPIYARLHPDLPWEELPGQFRFVGVDPQPGRLVHVGETSSPITITGQEFPPAAADDISVRLHTDIDEVAIDVHPTSVGFDSLHVELPTDRLKPATALSAEVAFDSVTWLPIPGLTVYGYAVEAVEPAAVPVGLGQVTLTGSFAVSSTATPTYYLRVIPFTGRAVSSPSPTGPDVAIIQATTAADGALGFDLPPIIAGGDATKPYPAARLALVALAADDHRDVHTLDESAWLDLDHTLYFKVANAVTPAFSFTGLDEWILTVTGEMALPDSGEDIFIAFDDPGLASPSRTAVTSAAQTLSATEFVTTAPSSLQPGTYNVWISYGGDADPTKRPATDWALVGPSGGFNVFSSLKMSPNYGPMSGGSTTKIGLPSPNPALKGKTAHVTFGASAPVDGIFDANGDVVVKVPAATAARDVDVSVTFDGEPDPVPVDHPFSYYSVSGLVHPIQLGNAPLDLSIAGENLPARHEVKVDITLVQGSRSDDIHGTIATATTISATTDPTTSPNHVGEDPDAGKISVEVAIEAQPAQSLANALRVVVIDGYSPHAIPINTAATITIGGKGLFGDGLAGQVMVAFKSPAAQDFDSAKDVYQVVFDDPHWTVPAPAFADARPRPMYLTFSGAAAFENPFDPSGYRSIPTGATDEPEDESGKTVPIANLYPFQALRSVTSAFPLFDGPGPTPTKDSLYGLIAGEGLPPLRPGTGPDGSQIVTRPTLTLTDVTDATKTYIGDALATTNPRDPAVIWTPPAGTPAGQYQVSISADGVTPSQDVVDGVVSLYPATYPGNAPQFDVMALPVKLGIGGSTPSTSASFFVNRNPTDLTTTAVQIVNLTAGQAFNSGDPVALRVQLNGQWRCIRTTLGPTATDLGYGWYVDDTSPEFPEDLTAVFSLRGVRDVKKMTKKEIDATRASMTDRWGRPPLDEFVPKVKIDYLGSQPTDGVSDVNPDFFNDATLQPDAGNATAQNPYMMTGVVPLPLQETSVVITPMSYDQAIHPAMVDIYNGKNDFTELSLTENISSLLNVVSADPGLTCDSRCGAFGIFKLSVDSASIATPVTTNLASTDNVISASTFYTDPTTGISFAADLPAGRAQQIYYAPKPVAGGTPSNPPEPAWVPLVNPRQANVTTSGKGNVRFVILDHAAYAAGQDTNVAILQEQNHANTLIAYLCVLSADRSALSFQVARLISLGDDSLIYGNFDATTGADDPTTIHIAAMPPRQTQIRHYTLDVATLDFDPNTSTGVVKAAASGNFVGLDATTGEENDTIQYPVIGKLTTPRSGRVLHVQNKAYPGPGKISYQIDVAAGANSLTWSDTTDRSAPPTTVDGVKTPNDADWTSVGPWLKVQLDASSGSDDDGSYFLSLYPPKVDSRPLAAVDKPKLIPPAEPMAARTFAYTGLEPIELQHEVVATDDGSLAIRISAKVVKSVTLTTTEGVDDPVDWPITGSDWFKQSPAYMGITWEFEHDPGALAAGMAWASTAQPSTWAVDVFTGPPSILLSSDTAGGSATAVIAAPTSNDSRVAIGRFDLTAGHGSPGAAQQMLLPYRSLETGFPEVHLLHLDPADTTTTTLIWRGCDTASAPWSAAVVAHMSADEISKAGALYADFYKGDDWKTIDPGRVLWADVALNTSGGFDQAPAGSRLGLLPQNKPNLYGSSSGNIATQLLTVAEDYEAPWAVVARDGNPYAGLLSFVAPPLLQGEGLLSTLAARLTSDNALFETTPGETAAIAHALGTDAYHTGLFSPMVVWSISDQKAKALSTSITDQLSKDFQASLKPDKTAFTVTLPDLATTNANPDITQPIFKTYSQLSMIQSAVDHGSNVFSDGYRESWTSHYRSKVLKCIPNHHYTREVGPDYWKRRVNTTNLSYMTTTLMGTEPVIQHMQSVSTAKRDADPDLAKADALKPLGGLGKVILQGIERKTTIRQLNAFSRYWGDTETGQKTPTELYVPVQSSTVLLSALDPGDAQSLSTFMAMMVQQDRLDLDPMLYVSAAAPTPDGKHGSSDPSITGSPIADFWIGSSGLFVQLFGTMANPEVRKGLVEALKRAGKIRNPFNASAKDAPPPAIEMVEMKDGVPIAAELDGMGADVASRTFREWMAIEHLMPHTVSVWRDPSCTRELERWKTIQEFASSGADVDQVARELETLAPKLSKLDAGLHVFGEAMNVWGIVSLAHHWGQLSNEGAWGRFEQVSGVTTAILQALHDLVWVAKSAISFFVRRAVRATASAAVEGSGKAVSEGLIRTMKYLEVGAEVLGRLLDFVFGVISIVEGIVELTKGKVFDGVMDILAGICFVAAAFDPEPISKIVLVVLGLVITVVKFLVDLFSDQIPDSERQTNHSIKVYDSLAIDLGGYLSVAGTPPILPGNTTDAPGDQGDIKPSEADAPNSWRFAPPKEAAPQPTDPAHPVLAAFGIAGQGTSMSAIAAAAHKAVNQPMVAAPAAAPQSIRLALLPPVLHQGTAEPFDQPEPHDVRSPDRLAQLADTFRTWHAAQRPTER